MIPAKVFVDNTLRHSLLASRESRSRAPDRMLELVTAKKRKG